MPRADLSRIPEYYHRYVKRVNEDDLREAFTNQTSSFVAFLENLSAGKRSFRYAEGKWTIQEMLQHIIDAERVFAYRALCFARKDPASLPSFDEKSYAENSKAADRNWDEMVEEFKNLRNSTELLFSSFDEEQLQEVGIASGNPVYVEGIGFIIIGHVAHHLSVIRERYLDPASKN